MPSLSRFILNFVGFALALYAGMIALDTLVDPKQREMVTEIRLKPKSDRALSELKLKRDGGPNDKLRPRTATDLQAGRDTRLVTMLESLPLAGK